MRSALDAADGPRAIKALNDELEVTSGADLPRNIKGDNALLILDRASIQQSLSEFGLSKRDFETADKAIDMLDLSRNAGDSIGEYVFSSSSGRYQAPPYEKLMINTLNMLNYLEQSDLNGARIEARRLLVMYTYYRNSLGHLDNPVVGLGSMLAGYTFEKSGNVDEALRYYDEALACPGFDSLKSFVAPLLSMGSYRSPRFGDVPARERPDSGKTGKTSAANPSGQGASASALPSSAGNAESNATGEVLVVVGHGRVPHKIANRIPIGLALTYFASALSPNDVAAANRLAAQGLVTWINFPSLAPATGSLGYPSITLDGAQVTSDQAVDVDNEVRREWKNVEGKVVVSAITRLVARTAAGKGIEVAAGRDNVLGIVLSLGAQATLTVLDTPDTRSWETLPARIDVARLKLPIGNHKIVVSARGWQRSQDVEVTKGSWRVVSLMALR